MCGGQVLHTFREHFLCQELTVAEDFGCSKCSAMFQRPVSSTCMRAYTWTRLHAHAPTRMHARTHACTHAYACMHTRMHACMYVRMHAHMPKRSLSNPWSRYYKHDPTLPKQKPNYYLKLKITEAWPTYALKPKPSFRNCLTYDLNIWGINGVCTVGFRMETVMDTATGTTYGHSKKQDQKITQKKR